MSGKSFISVIAKHAVRFYTVVNTICQLEKRLRKLDELVADHSHVQDDIMDLELFTLEVL